MPNEEKMSAKKAYENFVSMQEDTPLIRGKVGSGTETYDMTRDNMECYPETQVVVKTVNDEFGVSRVVSIETVKDENEWDY